MQIMSINSKIQSYPSTHVNFNGTRHPKEPAEKLLATLRDLYRNGNMDGARGRQAGSTYAIEAKNEIVQLLRKCGATELAKKLAKTVKDDLPAHY